LKHKFFPKSQDWGVSKMAITLESLRDQRVMNISINDGITVNAEEVDQADLDYLLEVRDYINSILYPEGEK